VNIDEGSEETPEQTIGGFDGTARAWVLGLFGIGGTALGVFLPLLSGWAARLPWMPFQGPLSLLGAFNQPWLIWGRPAIGLIAGLLFAGWVIADSPILHVSHDLIRVQRRGKVERVIERTKIDGVYRRGSKIVLESGGGRKLFEGDIEGERTVTRDAFVSKGYPWEGPLN